MTSDSGVTSWQGKLLCKPEYLPSRWKKASSSERKELLSQFKDEVAEKMGVYVKPGISFFYAKENDNGSILYGRQADGIIEINEYVLSEYRWTSSYKLFKTILHEMRHVYQRAASFRVDVYGYESLYPETYATRRAWADNWRDYDPAADRAIYLNYIVEIDARRFALQLEGDY